MGVRGELFSSRVLLPNRTYFFNVKENRMGDLYLNIVESKNRDTGGFDRQSVILFADDLQEFLKGFDESLRMLEKAVREKRRSGGNSGPKVRHRENDGETEPEGRRFRETRPSAGETSKRYERDGRRDKRRQSPAGEKPAKNRRPDHGANQRPDHGPNQRNEKGRRVVIRKHDR